MRDLLSLSQTKYARELRRYLASFDEPVEYRIRPSRLRQPRAQGRLSRALAHAHAYVWSDGGERLVHRLGVGAILAIGCVLAYHLLFHR